MSPESAGARAWELPPSCNERCDHRLGDHHDKACSLYGRFYEDHEHDMADPEYAEAFREATAEATTTAAPWWQGATDCPRPLWRLLRCRSRANGVGFRCDRHRWHRGLHHADRNGTFGSTSRDVWPVNP